MTLFALSALCITLLSCAAICGPVWRDTRKNTSKKLATILIFIIIIMLLGFGLYGYLGVPMIVMFTA